MRENLISEDSQEKIRCVSCGRPNHIHEDVCVSCGSQLWEDNSSDDTKTASGSQLSFEFFSSSKNDKK